MFQPDMTRSFGAGASNLKLALERIPLYSCNGYFGFAQGTGRIEDPVS
jgi:hypothetical protein